MLRFPQIPSPSNCSHLCPYVRRSIKLTRDSCTCRQANYLELDKCCRGKDIAKKQYTLATLPLLKRTTPTRARSCCASCMPRGPNPLYVARSLSTGKHKSAQTLPVAALAYERWDVDCSPGGVQRADWSRAASLPKRWQSCTVTDEPRADGENVHAATTWCRYIQELSTVLSWPGGSLLQTGQMGLVTSSMSPKAKKYHQN